MNVPIPAPIKFVSSVTEEPFHCLDVDEQQVSILSNALVGAEAREFYESVISEPCTSSSVINKTKTTNSVYRKKYRHSRRETKTTVMPQLTFRMSKENIFLRAASAGDLAIVKSMLQQDNSIINCQDQFGWTALMCAAFEGLLQIVQFLIRKGADKSISNTKGETALDLCLAKKHYRISTILSDQPVCETSSDSSAKPTTSANKKMCQLCKCQFRDMNHKCSLVHQLNSKSKVKSKPAFGIAMSNTGYKLLVKGGWNEESALGSEEQGRLYPIKTVLKRDRHGLGDVKSKKPRVTHFGPFDSTAVDTVKQDKILTNHASWKRELARDKIKSKQLEINFRRDFY